MSGAAVGLVGGRGSVEGLRLLDGDLVLKIECGGAAVQGRLRNVARVPRRRGDFGQARVRAKNTAVGPAPSRLLESGGSAGASERAGSGGLRDRQARDGAGRARGRQGSHAVSRWTSGARRK